MSELVLHTINPRSGESVSPRELPQPFEAVVRVILPDEEVAESTPPLPSELAVMPEVIVRTFTVPHVTAIRTALMFDHLVGPKGTLGNFNCHSYGRYASGSAPSPVMHGGADRYASRIVSHGIETEPPLQAGQQGVIGRTFKFKKFGLGWTFGRPDHSIIGLGDVPYCLQVTSDCGYLALSTYTGIFNRYGVGRGDDAPRLYVRDK